MATWKIIVLVIFSFSLLFNINFLLMIWFKERKFNKRLDKYDGNGVIACKYFEDEDGKPGLVIGKCVDEFTYIIIDEFGKISKVLKCNIYSRLL